LVPDREGRALEGGGGAIDNAEVVVTIDQSQGSEFLAQRVVRCRPGRSGPRRLEATQEILFVESGRGTLRVGDETHSLEPDTGAYVVSGEEYELENSGPDDLVVVVVEAPQEDGAANTPVRRTVRYADQPTLPAGSDREFRYLVNQDVGSRDITQFLGLIAPGRAPNHSHIYDEIVYIIDGEGILHLGGEQRVVGPGSAIHLPPLAEHCLENTGKGSMRVLGVFHPSGDPASRAHESK
jgi:mannose-6-phosphate isomerase-like protein (cupin superfamily)